MSAAQAAGDLPNRAKIWRGSPGRAALSPRHRAAAATPVHNKTSLRNKV
jgi:hypothetical protein